VASASECEAAYHRYGPALVRKAERILRNREDAVDVVQALFTELIARSASAPPRPPSTSAASPLASPPAPSGPDRASPQDPAVDLPYLYRAVTNRALNVVRDARGRQRLLEREQAALAPRPRLGDATRVIGLELLTQLCDRLDEPHREVLVARYLDELTQEEIAALYGVSRKTVGKRLARVDAAAAAVAAEAGRGARGGRS
jgi:RNA polymerase sigma-70 factor (ECF subfamily)